MKQKNKRGYFGIGVYHPKTNANVGTLWRSAFQLGAAFIFTIGRRYKKQVSDTIKAYRHVPLYNYPRWDEFKKSLPYDCNLVFIEFGEDSKNIIHYSHPERAIYILGAEDYGFKTDECKEAMYGHTKINLPSIRTPSFNVAMAGMAVMYDRLQKCLLSSDRRASA